MNLLPGEHLQATPLVETLRERDQQETLDRIGCRTMSDVLAWIKAGKAGPLTTNNERTKQ